MKEKKNRIFICLFIEIVKCAPPEKRTQCGQGPAKKRHVTRAVAAFKMIPISTINGIRGTGVSSGTR